MALDVHTIHEVAAIGSDGNAGVDTNGGGFNPTNANGPTDLAGTNANTASPSVTSATYSFVAGDVSHWVFVASGTNWTPGWYQIASVAAGAATLSAATGAAVLYSQGGPYSVSTAAGCATTASPSGGTFMIDYSQCGTARASVSNAVTNGTTTITSASNPFSKVQVGNLIYVTGGTGSIVAAVYEIVSDTGVGTIIVDRSTGLTTGTGATLNVGGCLLTLGQAGANHVGGNKIFVKKATYSSTSASSNVANGVFTFAAGVTANWTCIAGYNALRSDNPTGVNRPTLQLNVTSATIITCANLIRLRSVILDANSKASGITIGSMVIDNGCDWVTFKNTLSSGGMTHAGTLFACDATGNAGNAINSSSTSGISKFLYCVSWSNTVTGFQGAINTYFKCISVNNSGATSDGFANNDVNTGTYIGCLARGNGRDGWRLAATTGGAIKHLLNCIAYGNVSGTGFNCTTAGSEGINLFNCAAGNNSTNVSTNISKWQQFVWTAGAFSQGIITLTADPHTNAAGGDYSLNNTAGGGALLRGNVGAIGSFPGLSTTSYEDIGPVQHPDPAGGGFLARSTIVTNIGTY